MSDEMYIEWLDREIKKVIEVFELNDLRYNEINSLVAYLDDLIANGRYYSSRRLLK